MQRQNGFGLEIAKIGLDTRLHQGDALLLSRNAVVDGVPARNCSWLIVAL